MARIVFDIGGTNIKYGIFDKGELKNLAEVPTDAMLGGDKVIEKIAGLIKTNLSPEIDSIGISTAGQVNTKEGKIAYANENIPNYTDFEVKKYLEGLFLLPCYVENDVNCAGLGELYANDEIDGDFVFIAYGTGIGGAIINDSKALTGENFFGGGVGQMLLFDQENMRYCQYEDICSTSYLVKKARKIDPSIENGRMIFSKLENNEISNLIEEWTDNIIIGLLNLTYLIDPKYIVLGGGIMENDFIFNKISQKYKEGKNPFLKTEIKKAKAGNRSGLLGAAVL